MGVLAEQSDPIDIDQDELRSGKELPETTPDQDAPRAEQSSVVPTVIDPAMARAVRATEHVWRSVESEFGLLSESEVDTLLGRRNGSQASAADLRKRGEVLAAMRNDGYVFPGFQFDHNAGTVRDWVAPLLVLAERYERSAAGVIMWMVSPTTHFEEEDRPVDHLDDAHCVLDAAEKHWGVEW